MIKYIYIMLRYTLYGLLIAGTITLAGCLNTSVNKTETENNNKNTSVEVEDDEDLLEDEDYYDEVEVVTEDAYGKDLDFIERYEGSLRSYYSTNEYETDVSYQTTADEDDVRAFYNDKLVAAGWEISEDATDYVEFIKGSEDNPEIFTLYLTPYKKQNILEYELVYEPSLSDEQLKELESEDDSEIDF